MCTVYCLQNEIIKAHTTATIRLYGKAAPILKLERKKQQQRPNKRIIFKTDELTPQPRT